MNSISKFMSWIASLKMAYVFTYNHNYRRNTYLITMDSFSWVQFENYLIKHDFSSCVSIHKSLSKYMVSMISRFFTYIFLPKNWELYNSTGLINFFQQWPQNSDLKSLRIARIHYFRRPLILYLQHRSYPSSQRPQQPHRVVDMTQDMTQVSKYSSLY